MEVKLSWNVLAARMYTAALIGKSREQLYALLFNKEDRGSQRMKEKNISWTCTQSCPGMEQCMHGILRKEVADKRGHLPAQATKTLVDVRDPPEQTMLKWI